MANQVGERIRKAREARSMSQAHLAEAADLDERTIRRIEKGENPPSHESLLSLCSVLGLAAEELKRESGTPPRPKAKGEMVFVNDGHSLLRDLIGFHEGAVEVDDTGDDEEAASLIKDVIQSIEFAEIMPELPHDAIFDHGHVLTKAIKALEAKGWVIGVLKRLDMTVKFDDQVIPHWNRVTLIIKDASKISDPERDKAGSRRPD